MLGTILCRSSHYQFYITILCRSCHYHFYITILYRSSHYQFMYTLLRRFFTKVWRVITRMNNILFLFINYSIWSLYLQVIGSIAQKGATLMPKPGNKMATASHKSVKLYSSPKKSKVTEGRYIMYCICALSRWF